ncbi:MAG TPA: S1C family serine protease [Chthoniobacterales bacterium]|nr:S1C family serine protease [Chthoniobacterales bacterium]
MRILPWLRSLVLALALCSPVKLNAITVPEIVAKAKPAVVQIVAVDANQNPFKTGTGFFVSSEGLLLTNYHVIAGASDLFARTSTGAIFIFRSVVFRSVDLDVALLKFAATAIPYLDLGSSADAVEGQRVLVIGSPEGLAGTVTDGIISAFRDNRSFIQISAPISPGSSGSPVLSDSGQVIGIASSIRKEGQNLNFAIAVETVKDALRADSQPAPGNQSLEVVTTAKPRATPNQPRTDLNEFVNEFVASGNTVNWRGELSFYADDVDYLSDGKVTKTLIAEEINKYNKQWPQRSYWLAGDATVETLDPVHDVARAVMTVGFAVQNRKRVITGTYQDVIFVRNASTNPKVIFIRTQTLSREERTIGQ